MNHLKIGTNTSKRFYFLFHSSLFLFPSPSFSITNTNHNTFQISDGNLRSELRFCDVKKFLPPSLGRNKRFERLVLDSRCVRFFGNLQDMEKAWERFKKSRETHGRRPETSYSIAGDSGLRTFFVFVLPYVGLTVHVGTNIADQWLKRFRSNGTDLVQSQQDKIRNKIKEKMEKEASDSSDSKNEEQIPKEAVEKKCQEDKEFLKLTKESQRMDDVLKREQKKLHLVAAELLLAHEIIILPTTKMNQVSRAKKNRKRANILRFGLFYERMRRQMKSRPSKIGQGIVWIGEEYTSCLCSKCQCLHGSLGSSKRFTCPNKNCGFTLDRDENGAWNIYFVGLSTLLQNSGSSRSSSSSSSRKRNRDKCSERGSSLKKQRRKSKGVDGKKKVSRKHGSIDKDPTYRKRRKRNEGVKYNNKNSTRGVARSNSRERRRGEQNKETDTSQRNENSNNHSTPDRLNKSRGHIVLHGVN